MAFACMSTHARSHPSCSTDGPAVGRFVVVARTVVTHDVGTPTRRPGRGSIMTQLLDADDIRRALRRLAHELVEANHGAEGLVLMGIQTRGVPLARRLAAHIADIEGVDVPVGPAGRDPVSRRCRVTTATSPGRHPLPGRRQRTRRRPGGRRPVHRTHHPGCAGRDPGRRTPGRHPVGGAGRPRPPRIARSAPTMSARTSRQHSPSGSRCAWRTSTAPTRSCWSAARRETDDEPGRDRTGGWRMSFQRLIAIDDLDADDLQLVLDTAQVMDEISARRIKKVPTLAWSHRVQHVLRGLHADAAELRHRRQAPVRRRDELLRQGFERLQGRVVQGHRADAERHGRRRRRDQVIVGRCAPAVDPPSRRPGAQRR